MTGTIVLDTSISEFEQSNTLWEAIDAVCEELGFDARNSFIRMAITSSPSESANSMGEMFSAPVMKSSLG